MAMFRTVMTTDSAEADRAEARVRANIGSVDRWGRITDTLVGVRRDTATLPSGRLVYQVIPIVHNRDPLFDA